MLLGGDEFARTQHGNNNAWCQDNELSWYDWGLREGQARAARVHPRLIELRRAHPVFRRGKFLAGRESEGSGLPDVWWFRPDGRRMTQRDWQQPFAHVARRLPQRRGDRRPHAARRADRRRLVPAAVQRPPRGRDLHAARAALRRASGRTSSAPSSRRSSPARSAGPRAARCVVHGALDEAAAPRLMIADLPAAARARARLRRGPRARALPARARDLAPVPLAVAAGARRLDARLRRRRPDARAPRRSAARRGCARWPPRAWGSCSTSSPTTWASPTRTAGGPTSASARGSSTTTPPTAGTGASSTSTTSPACAWRTPRSSTLVHGKVLELVRDGVVDGLRVDHPDGLADPAGYLRGCATPAPSTSGSRRSCTPARSCATGRSRAPSATSSSTTPRRCSSTRRGRRRSRALPLRRRAVRGGRAAGAARAGDDDVRPRGRAPARRCSTSPASRRRSARAAGLPHLRRAVVGARRGRRPRARSPPPPTAAWPTC